MILEEIIIINEPIEILQYFYRCIEIKIYLKSEKGSHGAPGMYW
jgi:hypothetical protein